MEALPPDLARQAITHASWTEQRSDSYELLAFLGDSVLGLAVTTHLYPRLAAESHGAGRLTKIRAQAVSGRSCREVAERLGLPERLRAAAPPEAGEAATNALVRTERVLASVIEAVIGACYLAYGYERTAEAVVDASFSWTSGASSFCALNGSITTGSGSYSTSMRSQASSATERSSATTAATASP